MKNDDDYSHNRARRVCELSSLGTMAQSTDCFRFLLFRRGTMTCAQRISSVLDPYQLRLQQVLYHLRSHQFTNTKYDSYEFSIKFTNTVIHKITSVIIHKSRSPVNQVIQNLCVNCSPNANSSLS
ncbi:hypothetical protein PV328_004016 [Microctonus aethiopoides]|uniref:Uncharacterized protein n=1 Tax=Microctonus aethiopoides TaxID=144406 RepID=A0AA39F9M3_9HYME|nr:hypothetical protein PV328_004016 [Microctonus aethiopoides]